MVKNDTKLHVKYWQMTVLIRKESEEEVFRDLGYSFDFYIVLLMVESNECYTSPIYTSI